MKGTAAFFGVSFLAVVSGLLPFAAHTATTYSAIRSSDDAGITRYGEFVVNAILADIGLSLPDEDKADAARRNHRGRNDNGPKPAPPQKEKQSDDFFADDFFDEQRGFDDVARSFDREYAATVTAWNREYADTVARWSRARVDYEKQQARLSGTAFDLRRFGTQGNAQSGAAPAGTASFAVDLDAMAAGTYHVIPHALGIDVRNQVGRGTCAAFAGVRAIESVLWQHKDFRGLQIDLSEQYFYWLSKPECRTAPCALTEDGSWSDAGFENLLGNSSTALMLERDCPYNPYRNDANVTDTPLQGCQRNRGLVRVGKYNSLLRFEQVIGELARNHPVVGGFRLTSSFIKNRGLVRARDPANQQPASGADVKGHAMLLIGYIKLPQQYWADEGRYCVIIGNSWGVGYGVGGHACLTEQWMKDNRLRYEADAARGYFTSVESVVLLK